MVATDGETGRGQDKQKVYYVKHGKNVMSAKMLEISLLGVGTVLRLERDAWSMVNRLRQATNEYAPPNLTAATYNKYPMLQSPSLICGTICFSQVPKG